MNIIISRRSVREFRTDRKISQKDLRDLVVASIYAPSGSNTQSQRFLIVDESKNIKWISKFRGGGGALKTAQAVIVVFSDINVCTYNSKERIESWNKKETSAPIKTIEYFNNIPKHPIWNQLRYSDCAASIQNILLAAWAKGIASCWISAYQNMENSRLVSYKPWKEFYDKFNIPKHFEIMGIVALGYPRRTLKLKGNKVHVSNIVKRKEIEHYLI